MASKNVAPVRFYHW